MKNSKLTLSSDFLGKANGNFECYNVTGGLAHLVRLNKKGERMAPNAKNLLNLKVSQIEQGIDLGRVIQH